MVVHKLSCTVQYAKLTEGPGQVHLLPIMVYLVPAMYFMYTISAIVHRGVLSPYNAFHVHNLGYCPSKSLQCISCTKSRLLSIKVPAVHFMYTISAIVHRGVLSPCNAFHVHNLGYCPSKSLQCISCTQSRLLTTSGTISTLGSRPDSGFRPSI